MKVFYASYLFRFSFVPLFIWLSRNKIPQPILQLTKRANEYYFINYKIISLQALTKVQSDLHTFLASQGLTQITMQPELADSSLVFDSKECSSPTAPKAKTISPSLGHKEGQSSGLGSSRSSSLESLAADIPLTRPLNLERTHSCLLPCSENWCQSKQCCYAREN